MPKANDSWGIEVGANAIKAMRLVRTGSTVDLADYEVLPFKRPLNTPDLNVDEAIQVNLDAFLAKHDLTNSTVVVSVPGHMAFARFAKLPPVEPKKIPDIVRFEAVQQIPFPIEQVEWDYQVFQQEDSPDVEVGIFAITKERVMNFLNNYRQVNIKVDGLTLSPLAVYNAFSYEDEDDASAEGTIYMDIGTNSTDVIIVEDGGIWLRTLPIGGNTFTESLVRSFKLSFPKAEKLKREAGTSKYARQIFQAMRPVFADLVQELQRSLGYYQSLNRDADLKRLVGVGSTFRLPGLQKFLKQQLQIEVIRPDRFKRVSVEGKREADFAEHALNMATAYGLAVQGLGLEKVTANIMPRHIQQQRMWKAKQPWIAGAAACIAAAAGMWGASYFATQSQLTNLHEQTDRQIRPTVTTAKGLVAKWNSIANGEDPRPQIENVRRVLDYRDLWPQLIEDIGRATATVGTGGANMTAGGAADTQQQRPPHINIQTIEAAYEVGADGSVATRMPAPGAPPAAGANLTAQQMLAQHFKADQFWGPTHVGQEPRFVITVTGTVPASFDAASLLTSTLIKWVREHADQKNRPYTFKINRQALVSLGPVGGDVGEGANASAGRSAPSRFRPVRRRSRFGGPVAANRGAANVKLDVASLLPDRPAAQEVQPQDNRFVIRWTVQVRPPDDARHADAQPRRQASSAGDRSAKHPGDGQEKRS